MMQAMRTRWASVRWKHDHPCQTQRVQPRRGPGATVGLERLGWSYVRRDALAAERGDERDVLLKGRLKAALSGRVRVG